MSTHIPNARPRPDRVLTDIADYVTGFRVKSAEAYHTARLCLVDTLGCGLEALEYPACTKLLGPVVPGTVVPDGAVIVTVGPTLSTTATEKLRVLDGPGLPALSVAETVTV